MAQRYFEDVELGDEFAEDWTPAPADVEAFVLANRARMQAAGQASHFRAEQQPGEPRDILPGPMSMAFVARLVMQWAGAEGVLRSLDVYFRRLASPGEPLRALALVTSTDEEDARGVVRLDVYLENARGERPLQGVAVVELPRRPA